MSSREVVAPTPTPSSRSNRLASPNAKGHEQKPLSEHGQASGSARSIPSSCTHEEAFAAWLDLGHRKPTGFRSSGAYLELDLSRLKFVLTSITSHMQTTQGAPVPSCKRFKRCVRSEQTPSPGLSCLLLSLLTFLNKFSNHVSCRPVRHTRF